MLEDIGFRIDDRVEIFREGNNRLWDRGLDEEVFVADCARKELWRRAVGETVFTKEYDGRRFMCDISEST